MINICKQCLFYLRQGIFIKKIGEHLQNYKRKKLITWWNSKIGIKEHFDAKIKHNIIMRLHFDGKLDKLVYCEDFERNERKFIEKFLRQGDTFVDVGANIGLFTLLASYHVGKNGKVYAIEPTKRIFQRLRENISLNNFHNIRCYQIALSNQSGKLPLYVSQSGYDAWNSFAQPKSKNLFDLEIVECKRWDDFVFENDLIGKVTMMKIDVEGWETHLISGGSETLSRQDAPVLQIEFTDETAKAASSPCDQLYNILEKMGFRLFIYDAKLNKLVHDPLRINYPYLNLIATKNPKKIYDRLNRF